MASVAHLPRYGEKPMLKLVPPLRIVSHYITCRVCGQLEAIGSTPQEAEKRAVELLVLHIRQFHSQQEH